MFRARKMWRVFVLVLCFQHVHPNDEQVQHDTCTIDLECEECLPENMPIITSHRVTNRSVAFRNLDTVTFYCHKTKFLAYPLLDTVTALCENDRYRIKQDRSLRHLLELGCQENIFEDVQHHVENCPAPLQGRSYQYRDAATNTVKHLAKVCFDEDRVVAVHSHMTTAAENSLPMQSHSDSDAPLSLLGNFNQMFDTKTRGEAETLFADDRRLNRRVVELLKHNRFNLADQGLTSAQLLSGLYYNDQNMRVANFISNRVAMWKSVAYGNVRNVNWDVKNLTDNRNGSLDIHAGIHEVLTMRSDRENVPIYLKPGNRFPVPKYVWTVLFDKKQHKAVAIVTLNSPFVAVSEIAESVFCSSQCGRLQWLRRLKKNQNFETPLYGLTFCCDIHNFAQKVKEVPQSVLNEVPFGTEGLLTL